MFNFDEPRYEKVVSDALALRPQIEAAVDKVCEQGYSNIFFIGCGGTWAHTLPMKYWVETTTADVDVHCEIGLIGQNVCPRWGHRRRSMPLFQPFKFRARF